MKILSVTETHLVSYGTFDGNTSVKLTTELAERHIRLGDTIRLKKIPEAVLKWHHSLKWMFCEKIRLVYVIRFLTNQHEK
jgi:hypothetical protein